MIVITADCSVGDEAVQTAASSVVTPHPDNPNITAAPKYSLSNSGVPRKMLKFANNPLKYHYGIDLIVRLSEEWDAEKYRVWYEKQFGEPVCTFLDDRRVRPVADVISCARALREKQFTAQCLDRLRQSNAPPDVPEGTLTPGASGDGVGEVVDWDSRYREWLSKLRPEILQLNQRLRNLLMELSERDPKIARLAEKYAYEQ